MPRFVLTVSVLVLSSGFAVAPAMAQAPVPDPPAITTQGRALIKVSPDVAWVTARVEAREGRPGEAQRKAADAMTTVQRGLEAVGVPAAALRTLSYTLQPEMERVGTTTRIARYVARNAIEIRVDDLTKLGSVIDAAAASGAGQISGLRFDVRAREAVEQEALAQAARDAMTRATAIATGLGQTLGPVLRVQDQRTSGSPITYLVSTPEPAPPMAGRGGGGVGPPQTPVEPGEIEIRAQLTVVIAIR